MSQHPFADLAARWLRSARAFVGPRPADDPARTIVALQGAIRRAARWRRARRVAAVGAVGLAAAAAAMVVLRPRAPTPRSLARLSSPAAVAQPVSASRAFTIGGAHAAVVVNASGARPVTTTELAVGDTVMSRTETLALTASDGTTVSLSPRSEVELLQGDAVRWFRLLEGSVAAHVAKLSAGERFVVATADREVEVRGTRFRVSIASAEPACGGGTVTRVAVEEGVVVVRGPAGEARVAAGERWPADCPVAALSRRSEARRAAPAPAAHRVATADAPASSTLAAENDLFAQATRAERAGDPATALGLLDRLVARYPATPLREAAELERTAILRRAPPPATPGAGQ